MPLPIPAGAPGPLHRVPIPFHHQCRGNWCWAACAQMLLEAGGATGVTQCGLASQLWANCCPDAPCDGSGPCDHDLDDPGITALLTGKGLTATRVGCALTSNDVKAQIDAGQPVQAGFSYGQDGGHVVLIAGYQSTGVDEQFIVLDPTDWHAAAWSFQGLLSANQLGTWDATWTFT